MEHTFLLKEGLWRCEGELSDDAGKALAADPMPYGLKAARPVLETITQYVHEQGLTRRRVKLDEIFAPSTMDV